MKMQKLNGNIKKKDFIDSICYVSTFILIFLCFVYKNKRLVLYSFEVIYITLIFIKGLKENITFGKYSLWCFAFFATCLISYIYAIDQSVAFKQVFNIFKTLLIGNSIIIFINKDNNKLDFILKSFLVSALYLTVLLVINTQPNQWGTLRLGYSIGFNSNDLGLKMAISTIISVYFGKEKNKRYYLLAFIFSFITLSSGSRKAFILIVIGVMFVVMLTLKNMKRLIIAVPVIILSIYIFWNAIMDISYFYDVLGIRVEQLINAITGKGNVDDSTIIRLKMIENGIQMFKERPFLGYGIANYAPLNSISSYSHNNYIELLVGGGILGTGIYYSLYITIIYNTFKSMKTNKYSGLFFSIIVGLAIMEYGFVSYYVEIFQILLACAYSSMFFGADKKGNVRYSYEVHNRGYYHII